MKKVTIITVCLNLIENNRKACFEEMFDSVQNQTYGNIEHLIIDGASKDGTIEFINGLAKTNDNVEISVFSEPDSGIYNAMNKGIKQSTGEYILFMNSDDYYSDEMAVEKLVKAIEEDDADFVAGGAEIFYSEEKKLIMLPRPRKVVYTMPFCHQAMMCKKSLLEKFNGFDEKYSFAADYNFIFRILLDGVKVATIDDILVFFRATTSASFNSRNKAIKEKEDVMLKYYGEGFDRDMINKISDKTLTLKMYNQISDMDFNPFIKERVLRYSKFRFFFRTLFMSLKNLRPKKNYY